jgi:hypothetical protein
VRALAAAAADAVPLKAQLPPAAPAPVRVDGRLFNLIVSDRGTQSERVKVHDLDAKLFTVETRGIVPYLANPSVIELIETAYNAGLQTGIEYGEARVRSQMRRALGLSC